MSVLESVRASNVGSALDDWRAWSRADRRANLLVCGDSLVRSSGRDEVGAWEFASVEFVDHDGFECVVYWMRVSADVGMRCDMELLTWVEVMDPL